MEAQRRLWRQFCDLKCRNMSWCGSDQDNIMCTACFPVPSAMCAPLFQSSILDHPKAQKGERIAQKNLEQKKEICADAPWNSPKTSFADDPWMPKLELGLSPALHSPRLQSPLWRAPVQYIFRKQHHLTNKQYLKYSLSFWSNACKFLQSTRHSLSHFNQFLIKRGAKYSALEYILIVETK